MTKTISLIIVTVTVLVATWTGYRWHSSAPHRACQAIDERVLQQQVMNHLLRLAIDSVETYNIDSENKVNEVLALGQRIPDAIIHEGLNPGFRMTPPKLPDLTLVIQLPAPAIQAQPSQSQPGLCEGYFPVQVSTGQFLGGTLQWQIIDNQPHRFEFFPSVELDEMVKQFGIDLNLPLYHLTHHQAKVRALHYFFNPTGQKAAEAKAKTYVDRLFEKYGLSPDAVTFTVPMTIQ
ncbi:MAG: hypothetical protein Q8K50_19420 [Hydrogenophaga sp.]|nr:hypothetical protein [Hydrogenophaga sp.]